ncbi:MAG TPA: glycine cleavage system protein GcvH [Candidatus Goldiibacteriota bacterium]|nr:glycine cleavage system protein GcvH [Candidatus Goldiibacteriota bacterium]
MEVKQGYYYTKEHEWVFIEGSKAKVGISDYAQHKLGDITYVDTVQPGKTVKQFEILTGIESVKAASDVYAPVSGTVIAFNSALNDSPELINTSPYDKGYILEIEIKDVSETKKLMTADEYKKYLEGLEK